MTLKDAKIGAVVLAAGRSTRFRSARSKLVHELGGRPIIQWGLATLRQLGIDPIVAVVGPHSDAVRAACGPRVRFAVQEEPRGTGHAVEAAADALAGFDGSLLVLAGDLPLLRAATLQRLIDAHHATSGVLTLLTAKVAQPRGWGRIVRAGGFVRAIVEERDATPAQRAVREVNVGVYCVRAEVLFRLLRGVTTDNVQQEKYLTDIVARAVEAGVAVADVPVDLVEVGQINTRGELADMEKTLRARINAGWMEAGVTLADPDTAYIGPDVSIAADAYIGPNVHLRGRTSVGARCRIDGSAFVTDSAIGDDVHLRFGVVLTEAAIGAGCQIGPFAHLRPGTRLADAVHIGDFVETKNARLGSGAKANHLAYLGDVEVGPQSNIGAGTITCNYDGFSKQRTVIGARVQVGSDSTLVAPLTIGDDAYIATATTVRHDVPAGGVLVFNPREQDERRGWVAAFRARKQGNGAAARVAAKPAKKAAPKVARKAKPAAKKKAAPAPAKGRSGRRSPAR